MRPPICVSALCCLVACRAPNAGRAQDEARAALRRELSAVPVNEAFAPASAPLPTEAANRSSTGPPVRRVAVAPSYDAPRFDVATLPPVEIENRQVSATDLLRPPFTKAEKASLRYCPPPPRRCEPQSFGAKLMQSVVDGAIRSALGED